MNALISASDIKTFYSALHCLSRFSETFWLQCTPRPNGQAQIRLSAINPTNSAFCMFAFDPDFFLAVNTVDSSEKIECQIQLKALLSILRTRGRTVERLSLALSPSSSSECRFSLTLHCQHSITKVHRFTYSPKRGLLPTADPNPPNFFCINASTASEWTDHFLSSARNGEITFLCTPTTCIARSKEEEVPTHPSSTSAGGAGGVRKAIHTEVKIAVEEFKEYCILEDCSLTFSLREFKATVALAEALGVVLEVNFSDGDEPLFVRLRVESAVAAEFVIATTKGDRSGAVGGGEGVGVEQGGGRVGQGVTAAASGSGSNRSAAAQRPASTGNVGDRSAAQDRHIDNERSSVSSASHPPPLASRTTSATSASVAAAAIPNQSTPLPPPASLPSRSPNSHPPNGGTNGAEDDDETQPLFFPGASQLSLTSQLPLSPEPQHLATQHDPDEEVTFVNPTPVAQGGDPDDFLTLPPAVSQSTEPASGTQRSKPASDEVDSERSEGGPKKKRFKPLF